MKKTIQIISCCLVCATALTQNHVLALSPETRKNIEHWRTEILPTADSERYWATLKELGEKINDADVEQLEAAASIDANTALACMAHEVARHPERIDEISDWYGRTVEQVERELWEAMKERLAATGLSERDVRRALIKGWSPRNRASPPAMRLIHAIHGTDEYRLIWEAWMLSPDSPQRATMRQRMNQALSVVGDDRTIAILVEKCRVLPKHVRTRADPADQQKAIAMEAEGIRETIRAIGGKVAILGLLEYANIAEKKGFGGEGDDRARNFVVYLLSSSRHPRGLRDNPEWVESLRDPDNPDQLVPWDEKWKEFKPIIEAILRNPDGLSPEDIQTLQATLDAMPK